MSDRDVVRKSEWMQPSPLPEEVQEKSVVRNELRPRNFHDYPGQDQVKSNLKVFVEAAKKRSAAMDHVILHGPPGLGKTTLAHIIASELGTQFYHTSAPAIDKPGDIAGILAGMNDGDILFIDEIHRLSIQAEEVLYSAMEDFCLDIIVGQGPAAHTVSVPLRPFTLVGATTKLSLLSRPFLSRFGIQERLEYYDPSALRDIVRRSAKLMGIEITDEACLNLARRSRGTPRIANRILRRVADFAEVQHQGKIDIGVVDFALEKLGIDSMGLDQLDRRLLQTIADKFGGGPVGIETLAVTVGEEKQTIEEVYEPFLMHLGFVARSARGRVMTESGLSHMRS